MEGRMRLSAVVVAVLSAAPLLAAAQLRREPLIVATPFAVLNPPGSPIELAEGTITVAGPARPQFIRLRSKEPMLPLTGVIVRVAAGLFEDGMITYRLQMADLKQPSPPGVVPDPADWALRLF